MPAAADVPQDRPDGNDGAAPHAVLPGPEIGDGAGAPSASDVAERPRCAPLLQSPLPSRAPCEPCAVASRAPFPRGVGDVETRIDANTASAESVPPPGDAQRVVHVSARCGRLRASTPQCRCMRHAGGGRAGVPCA